jgi:CubicO group peptidase (beta-lactamase class C family)
MRSAIFATLIAMMVATLVACGAGANSSSNPTYANFAATVTAIVNQSYAQYNLPSVSLAIARRGVAFYSYSVGYIDLGQKTPAEPDSVYQIASISKQFTDCAILQLANASPPLLSLNDPIDKYFPGFDPRITIAQMATNISGLADYVDLPQYDQWLAAGGVAPATVISTIQAQPLAFAPGAYYQYSNSNFFVLGELVAKLTGMSFEDYLARNVLTLAGLDSTYPYLAPAGNAAGYSGLGTNVPAPRLPLSVLSGAGGMSSTVLELDQWDEELLGGKILPPAVVSQMITPPPVPVFGNPSQPSFYAYGLVNVQHYGRTEILHSGEIPPGFKSTTATFLDTAWSISIFVNNSSFDIDELRVQIEDAVCAPQSKLNSFC